MNEISIQEDNTVYLNGVRIEGLQNFNLSMSVSDPSIISLELLVHKVSHLKEVESNYIFVKGKKYRLVPYEDWIAPIADSIQF